MEEEGGFSTVRKAHLYGYLNLYIACLFGHRNGVHANLLEADVVKAQALGSPERGYIVQVSTELFITKSQTICQIDSPFGNSTSQKSKN